MTIIRTAVTPSVSDALEGQQRAALIMDPSDPPMGR
jgi:hypothetical protein